MDINFETLENEIYSILGTKSTMVLATSYEDKVTARSMSCVIIDKNICFQTDKTFVKYNQMLNNPNVALCVDNIQIEGIATIKKHPLEQENKDFINIFQEKHKSSFENYSCMVDEVVVEVEPKHITLWEYDDGLPYREYLNVTKNIAYRENYETNLR